MNRNGRRHDLDFRPRGESLEGRRLPTANPAVVPFLHLRPEAAVIRPNTPVAPFGAVAKVASFIDPKVVVINGNHVLIGQKSYVAPYATLDASTGFIKIGTGSDIEDSATIVSNPNHLRPITSSVLIGDGVSIGFGATVLGASTIGGYGAAAKPTAIGPNARIDGATIAPGAIVGALARVGPGVTVPAGVFVLPGSNVTTNAEASNPALGKVRAVTAADTKTVATTLSNNVALAAAYTTLYQGSAATGINPGVDATVTGVFNGNLAAVLGTSQEAGSPTVAFEPPGAQGPKFPSPHRGLVEGNLPDFHGRVVGQVLFHQRAHQVEHHLAHANSFRGDQGQPITIGSIGRTGTHVTINSPLGGGVTIGQNFQAGAGAVVLGGPAATTSIGDNVVIGANAVVSQSTLGAGATIGDRAYVALSTVAPGAVVPPGEIRVGNVVVGTIQW